MPDIHFRGTSEDVRRTILQFVASMSGRAPGEYVALVHGIKMRVGLVALSRIQEAFVEKAAGGMGEDGITWTKLKKQTIANRPLGPGDKGLMKGYGRNGRDKLGRLKRGFLTAAEDERWRKIFASRKAMLMAKHGMGEREAAARAAQIAWSTLKSEGAKTKLEVLGNRRVLVGRSSGRLLNSLSPGTAQPENAPLIQAPPDAPVPSDRILREDPGAVIVGSSVSYAGAFHKARPLWPASFPPSWNAAIAEAAASGVEEAISIVLKDSSGRRVA